MKFFPSPQMAHQLLHQCLQHQFPDKLFAPDDWVKEFDPPSAKDPKSSKGRGSILTSKDMLTNKGSMLRKSSAMDDQLK